MHIPRKIRDGILWFLFAVSPLAALDPNKHLSQYTHTAWRIQDGDFAGAPNAITQTADGYLWIGTLAGLVRFDGVRFVPWIAPEPKALPSSDIYSLLGATDGSLWIGSGHGLSRWKDGSLTNYTNPAGRVNAILEDNSGVIWVARTRIEPPIGPICKVTGDALRCYGSTDGLSCKYGNALASDADRSLWVGSSEAICRWTPASSRTYLQKELKPTEGLSGVGATATKGSSVWAGLARAGKNFGLREFVDGVWRTYKVPGLDGATVAINSLLIDRSNALWVGTINQGIYRVFDGRAEHFRSADGLSSDVVSNIYEDIEGNIWVATSKGIDRFRDVAVATFSATEGLTTDSVSSVLSARDGTVWIGNEGALDFIRKNVLSRITSQEGLPGRDVTSLFEDHAGRLWVGVDSGLAVYEHEQFRLIRRSGRDPMGPVTAMTEDIDHNIWAYVVGKHTALLRIRELRIEEEFPSVRYVFSLAADPSGGIWMGNRKGGLQRYRKGNFENVPTPDTGTVTDLLVDPDGSLWAATQKNGVMRFRNGELTFLTTKNGLPCNEIFSIVRDKVHSLWLYSKCGLVAITDSELQQWSEHPQSAVQVKTLDILDGAQSALPSFRPISSMSPDGRLWFANDSILQMIDTAHLARNLIPPRVHIEEIIADRQNHLPQQGIRLPPHTRNLEIDYTALSFAIPQKMRFRYKLEGRGEDWQEAGTRRQAFYSDLAPGRYRFHVIACNNDGVWNDKGATLDFSVLPAVYQTAWFRVACILTGMFIFWVFYRLRTYQIHAAISARFEERLAERTRLARELHDTLLQTIQGSKMIVDDLLDPPAVSGRPREVMGRLSGALAQALLELRTSLNSLRNATASGNDLAEAFRRAADDCANRGVTNIAFIVEGTAREMRPIVRDEIYRIGHEAIRNACQHSSAERIEVRLSYGDNLVFSVRDNGRGIDPEVAAHGKNDHFGLQGMRERARQCCGTLIISSSKDSGTRVELMIPGERVFLNGHPTWRTLLMKIRRNLPGTNWRADIG
jgi:signal transduction histidine kinase/ligand-binding sensor domain-containing protein